MNQANQLPDDLRLGSQLVAASMLRDPVQSPEPFVSKVWRDGWQQIQDQQHPGAIPFTAADALLDALLPQLKCSSPELLDFRDVVWRRGQAGLFSATSGLLLENTYPARFLRKRQCPTLSSSKLELTCSVAELSSLERAIYWPSLTCDSLHALITQCLPYAWPWLDPNTSLDLSGRVVIGTADRADDRWLKQIMTLVRRRNGFLCLSEHLPASLRLEDVWVPTPAYSVEAGFSDVYLDLLDAWYDQNCAEASQIESPGDSGQRLFLVLDVPRGDDGVLAGSLETNLSEAGWICRNLNRDGLAECLHALKAATQVVTLDPLVAWLSNTGKSYQSQQLLILGRQSAGLDLFQMIHRRHLCGYWFQLPHTSSNLSQGESCVAKTLKVIEACFG